MHQFFIWICSTFFHWIANSLTDHRKYFMLLADPTGYIVTIIHNPWSYNTIVKNSRASHQNSDSNYWSTLHTKGKKKWMYIYLLAFTCQLKQTLGQANHPGRITIRNLLKLWGMGKNSLENKIALRNAVYIEHLWLMCSVELQHEFQL